MEISYNDALNIHGGIPENLLFPGLHPHFNQIDVVYNEKTEPRFFSYQSGEHLYFHSFHTRPVMDTGYIDIESPYGYSGPVSTSDDPGFINEASEAYEKWCRSNKVLVEFIRFHPYIDNARFYCGKTTPLRQTVFVDLKQEDLFKSYSKRTRAAIRKADKEGLTVYWTNERAKWDEFAAIYKATMDSLEASTPYYFSKSYFECMIQWDNAKLCICEHEGTIIAGAIFLTEKQLVEYHLSAATEQGMRLGGVRQILHEAGQWAQSHQAATLHLGGGTDASPDNSLLFFKKSFSKNMLDFKVGSKVYFEDIYENLRESPACNIHPNRFIFYR